MSNDTSPEWTKEAVLGKLKTEAAAGRAPGLQVFLDRSLKGPDVEAIAQAIVKEAAGPDVEIGPVSKLGKSFAVRGSLASLERIAGDKRVTSVLPVSVDDILPKPK